MKKIKYLLFFICFPALFTACEDAYEIEPIGILDEETTFFEISDAQTYLNGIYSRLNNVTEIEFTSIFTDEVAPSVEWNNSNRDLHQMILNSTSGHASSLWLKGHTTVNRVNRLLQGMEHLTPENQEEAAELNDVRAQGRFIRAYAYLNLLSYFSTDMTDDNALGAMLFTDVPESNATLPRSKNGDIYALMESDLNYAFNNIKGDHEYVYPTKAAVEALKARMYAYRGKYTEAATFAQNVISNYGLSLSQAQPFDLSDFYSQTNTSNPYRQIWADIDGVQNEQIFTMKSIVNGTPAMSPASVYYQNSTRCSGSPLWGMSYKVFGMLDANPDDVRLYAYIDPTSDDNACNDGEIMIDKYPGMPGGALINNVKLIRLSEMYMILAEAAAANSNLGEVANNIHAIEEARSITGSADMPSYANQKEAWAAILQERRIEFFAEGQRYIDIKRLGTKAGVGIDRHPDDNRTSSVPTTLPADDYRFTMPIPLDELNVNPEIREQQNPGY